MTVPVYFATIGRQIWKYFRARQNCSRSSQVGGISCLGCNSHQITIQESALDILFDEMATDGKMSIIAFVKSCALVFGLVTSNTAVYFICAHNISQSHLRISPPNVSRSLMIGSHAHEQYCSACISVWVLYGLISRPEYLQELTDEMNKLANIDNNSDYISVSYECLQNAERMDSFIREVLRTKGDMIGVCRVAACDAPLAGYTIPKGPSAAMHFM